MPVRIVSAGGGGITLSAASTGSEFGLTLPATNGALGISLGTAQNSTSGTSIDFTGIPAGVRRVTVMFRDVSTNGTALYLVQLGTSGGIVSTGYVSTSVTTFNTNTTAGSNSTAGMVIYSVSAGNTYSGALTLINLTGNTWVSNHMFKSFTNSITGGAGDIALGGVLDRVRITTVGGTDTFDAGSINIAWEI